MEYVVLTNAAVSYQLDLHNGEKSFFANVTYRYIGSLAISM